MSAFLKKTINNVTSLHWSDYCVAAAIVALACFAFAAYSEKFYAIDSLAAANTMLVTASNTIERADRQLAQAMVDLKAAKEDAAFWRHKYYASPTSQPTYAPAAASRPAPAPTPAPTVNTAPYTSVPSYSTGYRPSIMVRRNYTGYRTPDDAAVYWFFGSMCKQIERLQAKNTEICSLEIALSNLREKYELTLCELDAVKASNK